MTPELIGFLAMIGVFAATIFAAIYMDCCLNGGWKEKFTIKNVLGTIGVFFKYVILCLTIVGIFYVIASIFTDGS